MKIYIPLASGQFIPPQVIRSLTDQTEEIELVPCCTPGVVDSNHTICKDVLGKLAGEANSRNLALDFIRSSKEEYVGMQDRDIMHLSQDNYTQAQSFLMDNPKCAIVSLPWKDYEIQAHIKMMTMMINVKFLKDNKNFKFRTDHRHHMCLNMMEDIKALGYDICYLPSKIRRVKELE